MLTASEPRPAAGLLHQLHDGVQRPPTRPTRRPARARCSSRPATTSPVSASACAHSAATSASSSFRIAAMLPGCAAPACAISSPRTRVSRTASAKSSAPAATSALYSPRLCPATQHGAGRSGRAALQRPPCGDACCQDGGLRVAGLGESFGGAVEAQLGQRKAEDRVRLGEGVARDGVRARRRPGPCRRTGSPGRGRGKRWRRLVGPYVCQCRQI